MNIATVGKPSFYLPMAIILFLVFIVAKLPANQVIPRLTLPPQINVGGISGTFWQGHAEFVQFNGIQVNNVNWQLSWLPLFWGAAALDIQAGNSRDAEQIAINGAFVVTMSTLKAQNATIYAPTPLLLSQVTLPVPVIAGGRVKTDIEELVYQKNGCQTLNGTGNWLKATVAGANQNIPLGNFAAKLHCEEGPISITTEPVNSLNIQATATIPHSGEVRVQGKFKVSDELPREVHNAAQMIGDIDPEGFHIINI